MFIGWSFQEKQPLKEKWVEARLFERIASGRPTARDREQLHQADYWAPSWPFHVGDFGSHLWAQVAYETAQFPYWLIEPELLGDVKDVEHNPGLNRRVQPLVSGRPGHISFVE